MSRVVVTGATGVIGQAAVEALLQHDHEVVALTRNVERARPALNARVQLHAWPEPKLAPPPVEALEGADAVLHLAGEPIAQRWSDGAKREIEHSRVLTTKQLSAGIAALPEDRGPRVLVAQSATGYYGPHGDEPVDESTPPGSDFLAQVTRLWEQAAQPGRGTRVVHTRTGVVFSPSGGALAKMLPPFRLGVGGPVAGGQQYVPWIHLRDVAGALVHCVEDDRASGAVNVTAPNPVTNAELAHTLGRVLHRPAVLPVPAFALRLLYGEMADIVLTGQRATPVRLTELDYKFEYPDLEPALRDVLDGR